MALGDDIRSLDVDIQMPQASEEAKQRYEQALEAYQRASQIFDRARRPEDLAPVSETLEEGRYAMAATQALNSIATACGGPGSRNSRMA